MSKKTAQLIAENEMLKKRIDAMRYIMVEDNEEQKFYEDPRLKALGESRSDYSKFVFRYRSSDWKHCFRWDDADGCGIDKDGNIRTWQGHVFGPHTLRVDGAKKVVCNGDNSDNHFVVCLTDDGSVVCINIECDAEEKSRFIVDEPGVFKNISICFQHAILEKANGDLVIFDGKTSTIVSGVKSFIKKKSEGSAFRSCGGSLRCVQILTHENKLYVVNFFGLKSYCSVNRFVELDRDHVMGVNNLGKVFSTDGSVDVIPKYLDLTHKQYLYVAKRFHWIRSSEFPSSVRNTNEYREIRKTQRAKRLLSKLSSD
jgi:hypothetical protein